ncbi:MAG: hypothetical protein Q4B85_09230 [Lachnospiraceae bacterium]|nr:hypothetical protein [Lachnospiraceae bacterium]
MKNEMNKKATTYNYFFENFEEMRERRPDKRKMLDCIFRDLYGAPDSDHQDNKAA